MEATFLWLVIHKVVAMHEWQEKISIEIDKKIVLIVDLVLWNQWSTILQLCVSSTSVALCSYHHVTIMHKVAILTLISHFRRCNASLYQPLNKP